MSIIKGNDKVLNQLYNFYANYTSSPWFKTLLFIVWVSLWYWKWLINQNFKIFSSRQKKTQLRKIKMGHFISREINFCWGQSIFSVKKYFVKIPLQQIVLLLIYCSKYSKWETTNQHFNTCYNICHIYEYLWFNT